MSRTNELLDCLRDVLLGTSSDIAISTESLSAACIKKLDPEDSAPPLVAWGCVLELRQLARQLLRKEYEQPDVIEEQPDMFGGLQDRYPGTGDHKGLYVPRMQMTYADRVANIERLRKEAAAKLAHADALEAETLGLVDTGYFSDFG